MHTQENEREREGERTRGSDMNQIVCDVNLEDRCSSIPAVYPHSRAFVDKDSFEPFSPTFPFEHQRLLEVGHEEFVRRAA